jgi:pSer/pThr/pTyr-binding forkhead associated (FHA) protein
VWRVIATDKDGREISRKELDAGEFTIGRDADRQMVIQSPSVSRRHCRVRVDGGGVSILDEGSANGVTVNGARIAANTPTPIPPGTRVEIAEFRLIVEMVGAAPMPPAPMPPAMPPMGMPQQPMGMPPMMAPQAPMPMSGAPMGMPPMMAPQAPMPMSGAPAGGPADLVRLIAEGGQYNGRVFDLPPVAELTVGRGVGNELVLDDPSMSRKHVKLKRLGGGRIEIEDLNSANGTYINGRKITTAQAGPGDTVRFGEVMFRLDGGGGGGGASVRPASADIGAIAAGPPWLKPAFLGLGAVTGIVWLLWLVKLILPSSPPKGVVEQAIAAKIQEAVNQVRTAQEAFNKREWQKAKEAAEQALETDPVNLEATRLRAQASRAAEDEGKYKQGNIELDKGTPDGFQAALRIYDSMSPDSSYLQEFADKLRGKLIAAGEDYYKSKKYRDSADLLCSAYRVAPAGQKPGANVIKTLRDAEKRARISNGCTLK